MKILIAEDDSTSRRLLQMILSSYGQCETYFVKPIDKARPLNVIRKFGLLE